MNTRILTLALLGVLIVSGCALNRAQTASEPIIVQTPAATSATTAVPVTDTPTSTPTATPTNLPPTDTEAVVESEPDAAVAVVVDTVEEASFVLPNCDIRMGHWPIHIVQPGDTLTRIAATYNTTVAVLAQENCLVDPNRIFVGQRLHVPFTTVPDFPVEPPPDIPLIDMGPQPAHICVVVPDGQQANIWGAGVSGTNPAAILVGTVLFVRRADNAYIVELQPGVEGWVSATEAHLEGTSCPDVDVPNAPDTPVPTPTLPTVGGEGAPPADACSVVRNPGINDTLIYRNSATQEPIAILGSYLPFAWTAEGGYGVELPGCCNDFGFVKAQAAHLEGAVCPSATVPPDEPEPLPVFTNEGEPPRNRCSVIRNPGIDSAFIYFGPADAFAPIGILGNWLPFVDHHSDGYEVRLPNRDHTGWIAADDASLIGNDCPDA